MYIIVDKSWITSVSTFRLKDICYNNYLILPGSLGYELFTASDKDQAIRIWNKLNTVKEKVFIMEIINSLIQEEIKHQKAFGSFDKFFLDVSFSADIEKIKGVFTKKQKFTINYNKINWEGEGTLGFLKILKNVQVYFPQIGKERKPNSIIFDDVLEKICNEKETVIRIYNDIRPHNFPPAKAIDYNWAVFRWLQIHLLYAVEYKRRYDSNNGKIKPSILAHDNIDIEYLMLGVLNKCLASDDKKIKFLFKLCCKEGFLFTNN